MSASAATPKSVAATGSGTSAIDCAARDNTANECIRVARSGGRVVFTGIPAEIQVPLDSLKPLPLDEGDRVVRLMVSVQGRGLASIDAADFAAMRSRITRLTDVGIYGDREFVIGSGEGTRSISAATVEANIFRDRKSVV